MPGLEYDSWVPHFDNQPGFSVATDTFSLHAGNFFATRAKRLSLGNPGSSFLKCRFLVSAV